MNSKGIRFESNGVSLKAVKAQQTHIQENLVSIQEGMRKGLINNTVVHVVRHLFTRGMRSQVVRI